MKTNINFFLKYSDMKISDENNEIIDLEKIDFKSLIDEDFDNLIFSIKSLNVSINEIFVSFEIQSDINVNVYKIDSKLDRILFNNLLSFKNYEKYFFEQVEGGLKLTFEVDFKNNIDEK